MRRFLMLFLVILGAGSLLFFFVPWAQRGGLSSTGPTDEAIPPNIIRVLPGDGDAVGETSGFCVEFDFKAGRGMDATSQESVHYYFNGWDVTDDVNDIHALEYPTLIGEPCFRRSAPLKPGWHTASVMYEDNSGNKWAYMWNFQVSLEE